HAMRSALSAHAQAKHWREIMRTVRVAEKRRALHGEAAARGRRIGARGRLADAHGDPALLDRTREAGGSADPLAPATAVQAWRGARRWATGGAARATSGARRWAWRSGRQRRRRPVRGPRSAAKRPGRRRWERFAGSTGTAAGFRTSGRRFERGPLPARVCISESFNGRLW